MAPTRTTSVAIIRATSGIETKLGNFCTGNFPKENKITENVYSRNYKFPKFKKKGRNDIILPNSEKRRLG